MALDERFGPNDVGLDVRTDQQHPLLKHEVQIATSSHGRAVLVLTFTAVDLWTAILTGMALVRQSGYVPSAVQASATAGRSRPRRCRPWRAQALGAGRPHSQWCGGRPGAGDNAAAALGVGAGPGDVIISIGTSGVVSAVADSPIADPTGEVIDSADATGRFLRLASTPIAARGLDATAQMLGVGHREFSRLALSVPPGSDGLVLLPYFEKPSNLAWLRASGVVRGLTEANSTSAHIARAAVEGILCSLAESLEALMLHGAQPERLHLVGGAARSKAVRQIAPTVFGQHVIILGSEELGACGAARQAAWTLTSSPEPPGWRTAAQVIYGEAVPSIRSRFADARSSFPRMGA